MASIVTQINAMASRGVWTRRGDPLTFDFTVQSGGIENIDADYVTVSVNGLDGDDHIEKLFAHANAEKLHAALHDPSRGVAIVAHDAIGKAAMIDADAQSGAVGFADVDEFFEARFEAF